MAISTLLLACLLSLSPAIRAEGSASCGNATGTNKEPLHIAYFTTFDGSFVSLGSIPAVNMALETINADDGVLPGYNLTYGESIYIINVSLATWCTHVHAYTAVRALLCSKRAPGFEYA